MKKTITLFALAITTIATAQTRLDSADVTAANNTDVFYSLENGVVKSEPRDNWHLAFTTNAVSASILINSAGHSAGSMDLFLAAQDTTSWTTLDTTGMTQVYNDPTSWEAGAFANLGTSHPDYGWGSYNSTTHSVYGSRIFVIKMPNDTYKKIMIQEMIAGGDFKFKYADLDGSNEVVASFLKSTYSTKNFVYYNMTTGTFVDREPVKTDWDMLFTKYMDEVAPSTYYPVTGVVTNANAMAEEVNMVDTATATWTTFGSEKNIIGYDWKVFDMNTFSYVLDDSTCFFVQNNNGDVFKIGFRSYGSGKFVFAVTKSSSVSISEVESISAKAYPNPTSNGITVELGDVNTADFQIIGMNGRLVNAGTIDNGGFISLTNAPSGVYLINLIAENKATTLRIIKK